MTFGWHWQKKQNKKRVKQHPKKPTKNLLCHHGTKKVLFHCCSVIHYPFVFGRCSRSIFVKVEFTPVSTKKENKGRSKSSTDRKSNNNTESMVKISFDHYSCVPNKSAARLSIQENSSFQQAFSRSNTLMKSSKYFLPICLFGPKHSRICKKCIDA